MKEQLKYAMELLADVAADLAVEDSLLHGTLSQELFDKLAIASSVLERVYRSLQEEDGYNDKELDFNYVDYSTIPESESDEDVVD